MPRPENEWGGGLERRQRNISQYENIVRGFFCFFVVVVIVVVFQKQGRLESGKKKSLTHQEKETRQSSLHLQVKL